VSPKDHAVKDSLTMFDVEEVWRSLSADDKAIVRDTVATGQSIYHKEVVNYVNDKQVHQKAADKYLQAVAELFAGEADQAGVKSHVEALENTLDALSSKSKFLAARNLSCYFNEKAQAVEFQQAVRNRALFDSNDVVDAQIEEKKKELEALIKEDLTTGLNQLARMDGEPRKKKQRSNKQEELRGTRKAIEDLVEVINDLYGQRTLASVVTQEAYDANDAGFYAFRRKGDATNDVGIYELFRKQEKNAEYCLRKFKEDKRCNDAKGFCHDKFSNRVDALKACRNAMQADLAEDKYKDVLFYTAHYHCGDDFKSKLKGKYFFLSPRVEGKLEQVE